MTTHEVPNRTLPGAPATDLNPDAMPRAMAFMVLSGLCFAGMGAMVKWAGEISVPTTVFFRAFVTLIITWTIAIRVGPPPFSATPHWPRLLLRALCGVSGVALYFFAIGRMPLADASLLNKTSPFFVAVFAVVLLREPFNRALVPALAAAFVGALLVIKPSLDVATLPALAGLGSGMFAGMAYVIVRSLKGQENPNRIILVFSGVSCAVTLPFLVAAPPSPTAWQWVALLGTGLFGAGGQFGLTYAYHHAPASRISIFTYLHVLFALLIGFLFWGERPDVASWIGGLLIVGAAVWTHQVTRREEQPQTYSASSM